MNLLKIDRSALPVPGPVRSYRFPTIDKSSLPNGLRVWSVRHPAVPVVTLMLMMRRGAAADPVGKEGLAAITLDMLDEGSGSRSAIELHEALAAIGAQIDSDIGPDASLLALTILSRFREPACHLLADIAARPMLTEGDFERVRQLRMHRLTQLRDVPGVVADRAFTRLLYGDHPYGHTALGTERALALLTVDDVRTFHATALRPTASTLIAVGDCDHAEMVGLAAEAFGAWNGAAADDILPADALPQPAKLNVVARPGASQSELRIGHVAVARGTPDYHALVAANMVLGGQFVSRINMNLRQDKGFTYGARTAFDFRRHPGPFALQASVQTEVTAAAVRESLGEIAAFRTLKPVTEEELAVAIAALTRGYARNFETADQVARALTQIALYDLPDDYFARFVEEVERLTTAEVARVAEVHLDPARLATLIVGDYDRIAPDLTSLALGEPALLDVLM